ncbi:unnamed protein product [Vicia faba]|uniref:Eukaryotic translation initiation factor 3 subunit E n=1 Tax=Vicia faba TaxID=3906 RepID=A0AAV1AX45_VICFA|nr:unnamed protein product [Vicia faba]
MAEYDLTLWIAPNLDRHLVFPLLEFLQERQLYDDNHVLKAKINLLNNTNMVDYAMDIHKTLYHTEDIPQDMVERRADVVARLKSLEDAAAPLVAFLQNPAVVQELRADKHYNLQMLNDKYQIGAAQIEALYQYAKFQFECGSYSGAADYLYQYRALCTNSERSLNALWGKLAAEVLMQNWDIALEELNRLKEIIDSKNFSSPINQVQSRIWLMHWSLFIFFNHDNGRTQIIDLFNQDKYLNAIQTSAPHLLRYLATAFIVNKRRRPQFKDFIKVIQQEQNSYKDPITEFLACVYVNYDFDGAQKKMRECEEVILNDPFLVQKQKRRISCNADDPVGFASNLGLTDELSMQLNRYHESRSYDASASEAPKSTRAATVIKKSESEGKPDLNCVTTRTGKRSRPCSWKRRKCKKQKQSTAEDVDLNIQCKFLPNNTDCMLANQQHGNTN